MFFTRLRPSFRSKNIDVFPEYWVSLNSPCALSDIGAFRDESSFDGFASGIDDFGEQSGDGWVNTETFFDYGLDIGQGFGFCGGDWGGDGAFGYGCLDLRNHCVVYSWGAHDMKHSSTDGSRRGI